MDKTEIIREIKKAMEFYQELGFGHVPVDKDLLSESSETLKGRGAGITSVVKKAVRVSEDRGRYSSEKASALKALKDEMGDCRMCGLSKGRKNLVFGEGNPDAELIFVGEGPGREEDQQARPFVGEAGKVLTSLIGKMGFRREDVYIANVIKCRPPSNRNPEEDEMSACSSFIERQIDIIKPKVIIALGRFAAQKLTNSKVRISRLRGNFHTYNGIPVMPTFHPAYLMRNPKDKWLTWDDVQKVLKKLKSNADDH